MNRIIELYQNNLMLKINISKRWLPKQMSSNYNSIIENHYMRHLNGTKYKNIKDSSQKTRKTF